MVFQRSFAISAEGFILPLAISTSEWLCTCTSRSFWISVPCRPRLFANLTHWQAGRPRENVPLAWSGGGLWGLISGVISTPWKEYRACEHPPALVFSLCEAFRWCQGYPPKSTLSSTGTMEASGRFEVCEFSIVFFMSDATINSLCCLFIECHWCFNEYAHTWSFNRRSSFQVCTFSWKYQCHSMNM